MISSRPQKYPYTGPRDGEATRCAPIVSLPGLSWNTSSDAVRDSTVEDLLDWRLCVGVANGSVNELGAWSSRVRDRGSVSSDFDTCVPGRLDIGADASSDDELCFRGMLDIRLRLSGSRVRDRGGRCT